MPINEYTNRYYRVQCNACGKFLPAAEGKSGFGSMREAMEAIRRAGWACIKPVYHNRVLCPTCVGLRRKAA